MRAAHNALEGVNGQSGIGLLQTAHQIHASGGFLLGQAVQAGGNQAAVEQHIHAQHQAVGVETFFCKEGFQIAERSGGFLFAQNRGRNHTQVFTVKKHGHKQGVAGALIQREINEFFHFPDLQVMRGFWRYDSILPCMCQ